MNDKRRKQKYTHQSRRREKPVKTASTLPPLPKCGQANSLKIPKNGLHWVLKETQCLLPNPQHRAWHILRFNPGVIRRS